MGGTKWTDQRIWVMGIVAAIAVALVTGIGGIIYSRIFSPEKIEPYPIGADLLPVPLQNGTVPLRIEAIHVPKGAGKNWNRSYDLYFANVTDKPVTLVEILLDTWMKHTLTQTVAPGGAVFPDTAFEFTYHPNQVGQKLLLPKPFVVEPCSVRGIRIFFKVDASPDGICMLLSDHRGFNLTVKDSVGNLYRITNEPAVSG